MFMARSLLLAGGCPPSYLVRRTPINKSLRSHREPQRSIEAAVWSCRESDDAPPPARPQYERIVGWIEAPLGRSRVFPNG